MEENENTLNDDKIEEVEAVIAPSVGSMAEITEEEFAHFVGRKADYYIPKFRKFSNDGFSVTWNWSAFFFEFVWMAYRKMYLWALAVWILILAFGNLPFLPGMVLFGMTGNYIYYRYAKKKILHLKTNQIFSNSHDISVALEKEGGVNQWAIYAIIGLVWLSIAIAYLIGEVG